MCSNKREEVWQLACSVQGDHTECTTSTRLPVYGEVLGRCLDEVGVECEVAGLDIAVVLLPFFAEDVPMNVSMSVTCLLRARGKRCE